MNSAVVGMLLLLALALPPARAALESGMASHMLVQIPLLAVAGAIVVQNLPERRRAQLARWNRGGISGALLALLASAWWMVPRALDLALASPSMELTKFVTLPLLVGAPLALSWGRLGPLGRGLVLGNVLPMWAVVGWMYVVAPVRVCNFYLVEQQVRAGAGLIGASAMVGLMMGAMAFRGSNPATPEARAIEAR